MSAGDILGVAVIGIAILLFVVGTWGKPEKKPEKPEARRLPGQEEIICLNLTDEKLRELLHQLPVVASQPDISPRVDSANTSDTIKRVAEFKADNYNRNQGGYAEQSLWYTSSARLRFEKHWKDQDGSQYWDELLIHRVSEDVFERVYSGRDNLPRRQNYG
jgi:hypothetical protein